MSLRIPLTPDQTLQTEFHEIERRLRRLEKNTGLGPGATSSRVLISGSSNAGAVNLQPIYDRLNDLENAVDNLPTPITSDFGGVGPGSVHGLVPAPGTAEPPTGVAGHVLLSDGTWGFPFRGLVQVATSGSQTEPPYDVLDIAAGVQTGHLQAADIECWDLRVNGDIEYRDTFWEDLRFPSQGINPAGSAAPPAIDTADPYAGTFLFDTAGTDVISGIAQLPHAWKPGTDLHPHIHWMPTDANAGNVAWRLSYQIADMNEDFPGTLTTAGIEVDAADGSAVKHQRHDMALISMAGFRESCIVVWKIERVGGDGSDTYAADARFLEFDFHYEVMKPGTVTPAPNP